jgi:membrane protein involved in colicin uptake
MHQDTQKWESEQNEIQRAFDADQKQKDREHDKVLAEIEHKYALERENIQREFDAKEAELKREHDMALVEANTKAAKEKADYEHKLAMQKLAQEHKNSLAVLAQELANEKAMYSYKNNSSGGGAKISSGSSKSSSGSKVGSTLTKIANNVSTSTSNSKINQASVLALGYGAISPSKLATLVNNGTVQMYTKNGQTYFKKAPVTNNYKYRLTR